MIAWKVLVTFLRSIALQDGNKWMKKVPVDESKKAEAK